MSFVFLDLGLLILFAAFVSFFLWRNKRNLKPEGSLLLYRTKLGLKTIDNLGNRHKKVMNKIRYVSIVLGWILMGIMIWLIIQTVYLYLTTTISTQVKAPLVPLVPYFPQLFGLSNLFPPFYFVYFIVAIIIVATVHEFSHGVFARAVGIKIKSTGFAFFKYFPALFGAFVEQNEKQMIKKCKVDQMGVLSAGVFANIVTAIVFFVLLIGFFHLAFQPAGVVFNGYSYPAGINLSSITEINGAHVTNVNFSELINFSESEKFSKIKTSDKTYFVTKEILEKQNDIGEEIIIYADAPSLQAELPPVILSINEIEVKSIEELSRELNKYSPGEEIIVKGFDGKENKNYKIILGENPVNNSQPWIGIWFSASPSGSTLRGKIYTLFAMSKNPGTYYSEKVPDLSNFVYYMIWWIVIINLLVGLFNMLPLGILDGGRFFYLGVWSVTKSEKTAKIAFAIATYFLVAIFAILMIKWIIGWF